MNWIHEKKEIVPLHYTYVLSITLPVVQYQVQFTKPTPAISATSTVPFSAGQKHESFHAVTVLRQDTR